MSDGLTRALLEGGLKAVVLVSTQAAREARERHKLAPASAALLAHGLTGGLLLASLQKGDTRVNLQLECDGPLRGLFVDAGARGDVRGYVKNPDISFELAPGPFQWRGALGNAGVLSVLRDLGHHYYRSSIELESMDLALDLNRYFAQSDQVPTRIALGIRQDEGEMLGAVAGVLVQVLPGGDAGALERVGAGLSEQLQGALKQLPSPAAHSLTERLFPNATVLSNGPVIFRCSCSRARALETIASLGARDIQSIIDTLGSTAISCHFCGTKQEISLVDLLQILEDVQHAPANN